MLDKSPPGVGRGEAILRDETTITKPLMMKKISTPAAPLGQDTPRVPWSFIRAPHISNAWWTTTSKAAIARKV